jgi:hypothetical protein
VLSHNGFENSRSRGRPRRRRVARELGAAPPGTAHVLRRRSSTGADPDSDDETATSGQHDREPDQRAARSEAEARRQ